MSTLFQASAQWATRPADERFTSLPAMLASLAQQRALSRQLCVASRKIEALPDGDNHKGLVIRGPEGGQAAPSHWAFGQLAQLAEAPAAYLRTLPSEIAADCINYGLRYKRDVEDVGLLLSREPVAVTVSGPSARSTPGPTIARAATGPRYGRIWNSDVIEGLIARFGDGTGRDGSDWSVPGEFGKAVAITPENTTLFAGDQDMFVFLADERNRVEIPERRNGASGELARGFFVWNSEVGSATLGVATFLFDYVCCNRIVWGAKHYKQVSIRHTPKAPVRWADEVAPALEQYQRSSVKSIVDGIAAAKAARLDDPSEFLAKRFGKRLPALLEDVSLDEEGHPIETLWDAACAVTAYARRIPNQDRRVELETKAGEILDLAAA